MFLKQFIVLNIQLYHSDSTFLGFQPIYTIKIELTKSGGKKFSSKRYQAVNATNRTKKMEIQ